MSTETPTIDFESMRRHLQAPNPVQRTCAARALADAGDPAACQALVEARADKDSEVVEAAAEALGRRKSGECLRAVLPLLDADAYEVRLGAATALAHLGDPEAPAMLQGHADDPDDWVREAVRDALANLQQRAQPAPPVAPSAAEAPPHREPLTLGRRRQVVLEAALQLGAQYRQKDDGTVLLRLALADAHHQKVRAEGAGAPQRNRGRRPAPSAVLTLIGPARDDFQEWALKQTLRLTRGAIGQVRAGQPPARAMTECVWDRDVEVDCVAEAIHRLVVTGHRLERLLTGTYA